MQEGVDIILQAVRERGLLGDYRDLGDIRTDRHEHLLIFNYTAKAQYAGRWNAVERVSRGLIIDSRTATIAARPFGKFFGLNEVEETRLANLPAGPIEVTDKMDGCFLESTPLNLWGGGTITIGEVVRNKLRPILMGMDQFGIIVPCDVLEHYDNGTKDNWLAITLDCHVSEKSGGRDINVMRVTDNHHIYINGRFQPAMFAQPGDEVTSYEYVPAPSVLHMIRCSLLGDGSITLMSNTARYQEPHKAEHDEYVQELRSWLGACAQVSGSTTSGYGTTMHWARSKCYRALLSIREDWYVGSVKRIPDDLSWMDDFAVAKWYMDDGSLSHSELQRDRALFATNGFCESDVRRLAARLNEMYGVNAVTQNSKGWNIRVNAGRDRKIDRFWSAIAPHIVPCMRYKLPTAYRSVPHQPYPLGTDRVVSKQTTVQQVEHIPISRSGEENKKYFPFGRRGLDIKTTTGNYFAKGILVHNSLGILHRRDDGYAVATRGSFTGSQAVWATAHLREHYDLQDLPPNLTLLFEIVYPENRVVLDYGERRELVLIGARTFEGDDYAYDQLQTIAERYGFPLVPRYPATSIADLVPLMEATTGIEGWVVRFANGLRVKVKCADYVRLHRIIFGLTTEHIRDALLHDWTAFLADIPPNLQAGIAARALAMSRAVEAEEARIRAIFAQVRAEIGSAGRKAFALEVVARYPTEKSYLFTLLDGRPIRELLLKNLDLTPFGAPPIASGNVPE